MRPRAAVATEQARAGGNRIAGRYRAAARRRALDVLSAFARPTTFREGVNRLGPRAVGGADWIRLMETIRKMAQDGVLLVDGAPTPTINAGRPTFGGAPVHLRMLHDHVRTTDGLRRSSR